MRKQKYVQHLSCVTITFFMAETRLESERQKKLPPLFHWELILFMSPKQAYSLLAMAHFEWSSCSVQLIPASWRVLTLQTWNLPEHQGLCSGRPQVSAMMGWTVRQLVSPSSKMLALSWLFLQIVLRLQPRGDRNSCLLKMVLFLTKRLRDNLYRFLVELVSLILALYTKGMVISIIWAISSSSLRVIVKHERCWPQQFWESEMEGLICSLTKEGYLGIEWENSRPLEAVPFSLQANTPLAWAWVELTQPEGFQSFHAISSRLSLLMSLKVSVRGVVPLSMGLEQQRKEPVFMVESQQPQPLWPVLGGILKTTHQATGQPPWLMQL